MLKTCEVCGAAFKAQRSTAKYCSGRCKSAAHRMNSGYPMDLEGMKPPIWNRPRITTEEAAEAVFKAKQAATDLSRCAQATPAPLCLKLEQAAKGIMEALKAAGL